MSKPGWFDTGKFVRYASSGLLATLAMFSVEWALLAFGQPTTDYAAMYAAAFNHHSPPLVGSPLWFLGLSAFLVIGTFCIPVFALWNRYYFGPKRIFETVEVMMLCWVGTQLIAKPLAGDGFASSEMDKRFYFLLVDLVLCTVYAVALTRLVRSRVLHEDSVQLHSI